MRREHFILLFCSALFGRKIPANILLRVLQIEDATEVRAGCQLRHFKERKLPEQTTLRWREVDWQGGACGNKLRIREMPAISLFLGACCYPQGGCIRTQPQAVLAVGACELVESATLVIRAFSAILVRGGQA